MTHSIYQVVTENKSLPAEALFARLEGIVPGLFDDIYSLGGESAKSALLYVIEAYSKESQSVVLGASFSKQKELIAETVNLPDHLHGQVVELLNERVRNNVLEYLEYQSDREWQHYMWNQILYEELGRMSVLKMKKEDGTTDVKLIVDTAKHRDDLLKSIRANEAYFKATFGFVIENKREIREMSGGKGNSLRIEDIISKR